ncbi:unnamed protein product [Tetraodon nigroviridis]|uniref:(spotted green pufferfish) hypothetical protein n=1 Tax=Tetraodon nigroviridis TaxID=99883 RepID=Q4SET4_TETNG|nr:unnamed protein product [Tetraodon nigroviridis]
MESSQGPLRCKIVVVGDAQCGKTALLHVFAKDSYPESYIPTVFENYTASFEIDKQRIELNMWDTSGSAYYDNVRPLAYPDADAVLICFDVSRPETLNSVTKKRTLTKTMQQQELAPPEGSYEQELKGPRGYQLNQRKRRKRRTESRGGQETASTRRRLSWQAETQEFCPSAKVVLVGCKMDMRTDLNVMRELAKHRLIPVTHEQGTHLARQIGAVAYAECTSRYSENTVRDVFHVTTLASVSRLPHRPLLKRTGSRRGLKRVSQQPPRTEIHEHPPTARKDRAKSCALM